MDSSQKTLNLDLGCGDRKLPGFVGVDLYDKEADVRADVTELPFEDDSVSEIVCYQVIEHVPYNKSEQLFEEMYRVLKKGGTAIIETPDIDVVCRKILEEGLQDKWIYNLVGEYYRPWDKDRYEDWEHNAASIHRNPWNFERLERFARQAGFKRIERRLEADFYPCEENLSVALTK